MVIELYIEGKRQKCFHHPIPNEWNDVEFKERVEGLQVAVRRLVESIKHDYGELLAGCRQWGIAVRFQSKMNWA